VRIISISGKNLASLEGEFRIDFETGPLAGTGLFALTGPTGSGKSTILDALCVALYDRTPRLSQRGGPLIGGGDDDSGKLAAWDVRSLLRRGTGSGCAEVVFAGRNGQRYQARWEVRRARESATGKFQNQSIIFRNLTTGQLLGGTKTETLTLIQETVGLTYEQFCRSVLLAQGEFAAFLKADGRERAELLERITGTGIYSRISVAAFRRMTDEKGRLDDLLRQQGDIVILTDEERRGAEGEVTEVTRELEACRERLQAAEQAESWYGRQAALRQEADGARQALAEAESASAAAESLRREVSAVEEALPLQPLLEGADRTRREHGETLRTLHELTTQLEGVNQEVARDETAVESAREAKQRAEEGRDATRPLLDRARELDTRLADGRLRLASVEESVATARASHEDGAAALTLCRQEAGVVAGELADAGAWLDAHRHVESLAGEWNLCRLELERYVAAHGARQRAGVERDRLAGVEHKARQGCAGARERLAIADEVIAARRQELALAEERLRGYDGTGLREDRLELEVRREIVREMLAAARLAADAARDAADAGALAAAARQEAAVAEQTVRAGADEKIRLDAALAEAELALRMARSALDLEQYRPGLVAGEPCPLCGSPDHPWAGELPPVVALIGDQEARVALLRGDKEELDRRIAAAGVTATAAVARAEHEEERARGAAARLGQCREGWVRLRADSSCPELPMEVTEPSATECVEGILLTMGKRLEAIGRQERELTEAQQAERAARETFEAARSERERAAEALSRDEETHRTALQALEAADRSRSQAATELERITGIIVPYLAGIDGWETGLRQDPAAFLALCTTTVAAWVDWTTRRDGAARRAAALEVRLAELRTRCDGFDAALRLREDELTLHREAVQRLQKERHGVLGGRAVLEAEEELRSAVLTAEGLLDAAQKALGAALSRQADLNGRVGEARRLIVEREQAMTMAAATLAEALARRGAEEDEVRALISLGSGWLGETRETLRLLDEGLQHARILVAERDRVLADHEAAGAPGIPEPELPAVKAERFRQVSSLEERQFALRHRIETDDGARRKHAELLPRITAQRATTELWQGLSELIGSADGKKFRTYAQSLTLDVLLGYANEHLFSLAPRYGVMRVPQAEMELQMVDRDMGDEVRSVNSLSGGESFLVSLALALGLSSLSAHMTPVESLFVDEGFGTLDQETLEVALATLDSLQASGRKVGIISHVPGLAERIGARVEVVPRGGGRSTVRVAGAV